MTVKQDGEHQHSNRHYRNTMSVNNTDLRESSNYNNENVDIMQTTSLYAIPSSADNIETPTHAIVNSHHFEQLEDSLNKIPVSSIAVSSLEAVPASFERIATADKDPMLSSLRKLQNQFKDQDEEAGNYSAKKEVLLRSHNHITEGSKQNYFDIHNNSYQRLPAA